LRVVRGASPLDNRPMSTAAGSPHPAPTDPLRRARTGSWVGGVCAGLAQRTGVPVRQIRLLVVFASALLGLGVLVYAAVWLVLPAEDAEQSPPLVRAVATLALVAAATAGLMVLGAIAAAATLFGFGWVVAVAAGVLLVTGLVAWPAVRPAWVLLPLAGLAAAVVGVAATGLRLKPQTGVVLGAPRTPAEVPAAGYGAGLGDVLVDLRNLRAPARSRVPVSVRAGTGRTVVALPRDRCVDVDLRYRTARASWAGSRALDGLGIAAPAVAVYGRAQPGASGRLVRRSRDAAAPTVVLDVEALRGSLVVRDYPRLTGPLFDSDWPSNVAPPESPGAHRYAWRETVRTRANRARWRAWRAEVAAFERTQKRLRRGACATSRGAA